MPGDVPVSSSTAAAPTQSADSPPPAAPPAWWPAPPTTVPVPMPVPAGVNGLAVASLALGLAWNIWIGSIAAVVFGHVALSQIKASRGLQSGRGYAIAGVTLGWVGVAILVLLFAIGALTGS